MSDNVDPELVCNLSCLSICPTSRTVVKEGRILGENIADNLLLNLGHAITSPSESKNRWCSSPCCSEYRPRSVVTSNRNPGVVLSEILFDDVADNIPHRIRGMSRSGNRIKVDVDSQSYTSSIHTLSP